MDENQDEQANENEIDSQPEKEPSAPKRSFIVNENSELKYEPRTSPKKSGKKLLLIIGLIILILVGGFFLNARFKAASKIRQIIQPTPIATPTTLPSPTPIEPVLNRSEWSFEILNGSGVTGAAKKLADKIQTLGYSVVKTGNADKDNYAKTQIEVKKELLQRIDLVIADLKDTIKIASVAGELKEGTASARIIIGKDAI